MKHRPEIDGLRAVAVLPVLLFHADIERFSGGFVGVDVFFVISGYLITSIIVGEAEEGRFSLTNFYFRRVRRIVPALVVVTAFCLPMAAIIMLPVQLEQFSRSLIAVALFGSNILFWGESGYFATASELKPLLHTWSLAVEEQYYIIFPMVVMLVYALGAGRRLPVVLGVAALVSFGLSEWASRATEGSGNFYLLPTRAWELLTGALCALYLLRREPMRNDILAAVGLAGILIPVLVYHGGIRFPSIYALPPVLGSALIILFATPKTLVGRVLTNPVTVGIGLISYSAYLWHYPLYTIVWIRSPAEPSELLLLALGGVSLGLAWLTWLFVEQPIRRIRSTPEARRRLFTAAAAVAAVFIGVGAFGATSNGFETLWLATRNDETRARYAILQASPVEQAGVAFDEPCRFKMNVVDDETIARIERCFDEHGPGLAFFGDSHANNVFNGVAMNAPIPFLVVVSEGGCTPFGIERAGCAYIDDFPEYLRERPGRFSRIIFTLAGHHYLDYGDGRIVEERDLWEQNVPVYAVNMEAAGKTIDYIERLIDAAGETQVTWLGPRMEPWIRTLAVMHRGCEPGAIPFRPNLISSFERIDATLRAEAAAHQGGHAIDYVSEQDLVRFDPATDYVSCEALYWADEDHWSFAGSERFGQRLVGPLLDGLPLRGSESQRLPDDSRTDLP